VPVVFTFSFSSKELKNNPLKVYLERLEPFDIKCVLDYVQDSTSHVVQKKRNTPKGLQALVNGKYIVAEAFVEAIETLLQPPHDGSEDVAMLESDFDAFWPNPLAYLPPRGLEPTDRPDSAYAPDASRQEIFEGYTFVFYDQGQFDTLLPVITNGRGKAVLHSVHPEVTPVDEFAQYVKGVAGKKDLGEFDDGSESRGVIIVRFAPTKGSAEWYANFVRGVSQSLGYRLMEQNEFLDAILKSDASILKKALEPEVRHVTPQPEGKYHITLRFN
jgi:hypothetical protein